MLGFLYSCFNENTSFDHIIKAMKPNNPNYCIFKDDPDKKVISNKLKRKVKGEAKPLLQDEEREKLEGESAHGCLKKKGGAKVKILMTKGEAKQLLLKCKKEGVLEMCDVASELAQIPCSRVNVVASSNCGERVHVVASSNCGERVLGNNFKEV